MSKLDERITNTIQALKEILEKNKDNPEAIKALEQLKKIEEAKKNNNVVQ